ncbi:MULTISPECIES: hypothetical protein [unclassified Mesorhizobium]|uniref:hypothetical protein n=1 Tax=unclassified Mesorhizobium TaxID=325217 RepID=UPI000FCA7C80|nr:MULTISPECIES: hypothetical protein [unclassified Mesorhizobium]RUZ77219.1 hypothetical protein EN943_14640 [Mesorhizobium sp. M7A.F.Ca.US.006.01.1.1]RUZ95847.1 hypothetical protein EN938_34615 [Mesorhizobium sp. M7A.F.Ca.US.001.02.1.1]RVA02263.1 hypothetical protein EN932_33425 [Mesorhizobium sp. M7A.F.Ca.US.002.01.1.1]
MAESLDFELGRARLRVKRAEKSLSRAKEETDRENGVAVNIALCCRIRAARHCVMEARERQTSIVTGRHQMTSYRNETEDLSS